MSFYVGQTLPSGGSRIISTEPRLVESLAGCLDELDTVDLAELKRLVEAARQKAIRDESRTRPVRLHEPTVAVPASAVHREHRHAVVETNGQGELD